MERKPNPKIKGYKTTSVRAGDRVDILELNHLAMYVRAHRARFLHLDIDRASRILLTTQLYVSGAGPSTPTETNKELSAGLPAASATD